jgi:glycerate 2-kinase
MKFVIAPDSFKESIGAPEAAAAIGRGIRRVFPDALCDLCPIADGGEGTVEALVAATGGTLRHADVMGPLGERVRAAWGLLGDGKTAVVEMAAASGLPLVPAGKRNPMLTTTYGTGELIKAALDAGVTKLILGIGGSATTDGGTGAAQALGYRFLDSNGEEIKEAMAGGLMARVARIDKTRVDARLAGVTVLVACDVTNPLTGPNGSAAIYGPQKGATPEMVGLLDRALGHLAGVMKKDLGCQVEMLPGAGAAGGLGAGSITFFGAKLSPGIALVLDAVGFDARVKGAAGCLTGEGRIDGQSLAGKACLGVANGALKHGVKTWALVGSTGPGAEDAIKAGLAGYDVIGKGLSKEESMRRAGELLEAAGERWARGWSVGGR